MNITLTPTDSGRYQDDIDAAYTLEEMVAEWAEVHGVTDPIVVHADDGSILFALTPAAGRGL